MCTVRYLLHSVIRVPVCILNRLCKLFFVDFCENCEQIMNVEASVLLGYDTMSYPRRTEASDTLQQKP